MSAAGATVLLSSHILSEVEQLCNRVSIIRAGQWSNRARSTELRRLTRTEVVLQRGNERAQLSALPGVADVQTVGGRIRLTVEGEKLAACCRRCPRSTCRADHRPPSLEELFLRHYGDELAAAEAAEGATAR